MARYKFYIVLYCIVLYIVYCYIGKNINKNNVRVHCVINLPRFSTVDDTANKQQLNWL